MSDPVHSSSPAGAQAERVRALQVRQRAYGAIRRFFADRQFLEVETPVRIPTPALEDYIEAEPCGTHYLRTSPELHMKRLLAAGLERIYQIGPCFRAGERGTWHLPEFTMLEWYRSGADYLDILGDTIDLVRTVAGDTVGNAPCSFRGRIVDLCGPWERVTVDDAFDRFAGCSVDAAVESGEFEQILVEQVEPQLGNEVPTVLMHYPIACSGLSRRLKEAPTRVERWEFYVAGLEIGNACSELVDAAEQQERFAACARLREAEGRPIYAVDDAFMAAMRDGMPPCAGIAIGIDRLVAVLAGASSIAEVTAFGGES